VNDNWEGCGRKRSCSNLRYYPSICLYELRRTTKNLSQDSRYPSRDLNLGLPEYKSRVTATRPQFSVLCCPLVEEVLMRSTRVICSTSVDYVYRLNQCLDWSVRKTAEAQNTRILCLLRRRIKTYEGRSYLKLRIFLAGWGNDTGTTARRS
jgi:hypothetical protein